MVKKEEKLDRADPRDPGIGSMVVLKLWVKDRFVDAVGIDDIMEEVFRMHLKDRNRIAEEIMIRFIANNPMNRTLEREYRSALIDEYDRRQLPYL
jgi:hypothetical protein